VKNTLAYCSMELITSVKSFRAQARPVRNVKLDFLNASVLVLLNVEFGLRILITLFADKIGAGSFRRSVDSSTCHFVDLPFFQLAILSTCHSVDLPFFQLAVLPTCYCDYSSFYQLAVLSTSHFANLLFC
jgi:hypothetical protein